MHDKLLQYIRNHSVTPLSDKDVELIKSIFKPKKFRKRQYFLEPGEVCEYSAFILQGAMRQYSVDEKGAEHIVRLSIENWWAGDRESFVKGTPSIYYIDAWEDSDVLCLSRSDAEKFNTIPAMIEMSR